MFSRCLIFRYLLCAVVCIIAFDNPVYSQGVVVPGESRTHFTEFILVPGMLPGNYDRFRVMVCKPTVVGITPELGRYFKHGQNCGNAGHRTKYDPQGLLNSNSTDRNFEHFHLNYSYPIDGAARELDTGLTLVSETVTESNVTAFWHDYFTDNRPNWTYYGGVNPLVNCWGYAFGYSVWVQNPSFIYNSDYRGFASQFGVKPGHLIETGDHVIVVSEVDDYPMSGPLWAPGFKMVTKTLEKNRSSGIYEVEYDHTNQRASGFRVKTGQ